MIGQTSTASYQTALALPDQLSRIHIANSNVIINQNAGPVGAPNFDQLQQAVLAPVVKIGATSMLALCSYKFGYCLAKIVSEDTQEDRLPALYIGAGITVIMSVGLIYSLSESIPWPNRARCYNALALGAISFVAAGAGFITT